MGLLGAGCQGAARSCHNPRVATADVVVIGGGANGASTAFHLATVGVPRVVLLERHHLGAGATGKSGSLVRMHYTNEAESRLAFESLKIFRDFQAIVGGDCGFEPAGFIQIVGTGYERALAHNVDTQRRIGIDTQVITREELRRLLPGGHVDDIGAAAWEPGSGFADPNATTFAFAEAARRRGVTIRTHCEARRILVERGRVVGVETAEDRIAAPVVVVAAGAWATGLLAPLGVDYGLRPHRVQISILRWPAGAGRHGEARGIRVDRGRVVGVETAEDRLAAPVVVVAAGAWATGLLAPLGLDYGLRPHRVQISTLRWPAGFGHRHPAVIDAIHQSWFRPEGLAPTLAGVEPGGGHADPEPFDESGDPDYVAACREQLEARLPVFADPPMRGRWAGMIMMSPAGRPCIGPI